MIRADVLAAEARQSWRGLLRRPGYLVLAVLTLALGVGTVSLVFSLLDQALLRPLPYAQPERLVTLGLQQGQRNIGAPGLYAPVKRMRGLESSGIVMAGTGNINIVSDDVAEVASGLYADRGFLQTLGMQPVLGRNFDAEEDRQKGPMAAILSHEMWQRRFGGDPQVLDRSLQVEGEAVRIVGVLPRNFEWPARFDLLLSLQPDLQATHIATNEFILGRLREDATLASVSAEADVAMRAVLHAQSGAPEETRRFWSEVELGAVPLAGNVFTDNSGDVLWLFLAAALCVLVIAAVNLANLMLLRMLGRSHDSAVRAALGAPLLRLALPALAEGVLVGLLGAAAGLLLAWVGVQLLGGLVPPEWVRGQQLRVGASSVAFALLVGLAVAMLAASLGVWRSRTQQVARELVGGGGAGPSRSAGRLGRALVVAQVAVAVMLLIVAALFARSLHKLSTVPMGFESRSIVTFSLSPVLGLYPDMPASIEQTRRILEALHRQPGVLEAGAATNLPTGSQFNMPVQFPDGRETSVQYRPVTADFLRTFGVPLLAGRALDERRDVSGSEPVCVVSAAFAREYLEGDALGQIITLGDDGSGVPFRMRVVGVVGDVHQFGPANPPPPVLYTPLAQVRESTWSVVRHFMPLMYAVRMQPGTSARLEMSLRDAIAQVAPQQPIGDVRSMQAVVAATTGEQKLNLLLVGVFSGLALLLAAVGLYAVMAVTVAARRHEFGVRAALGASPGRLLRQVLRECGTQVALGLGVGLAAALAVSRLLEGFLFGIGAADPLAIVAVLSVLALAALMAGLVPALRAARVPPMQALRID